MTYEVTTDRFVPTTHRVDAWERLGQPVSAGLNASQAITEAGVDFAVESQDLYLPDGNPSGYVAIVREAVNAEKQPRVLGVAKSYDLVHVSEIAKQLDEITWPVATVGSIHKGGEIFVTYNLGGRSMVGEEYKMYLTVMHPYVPGKSWRAIITPIRLHCTNQLIAAKSLSHVNLAVAHHSKTVKKIDMALLDATAAARTEQIEHALENMASFTLKVDEADSILRQVFPDAPDRPTLYVEQEVFEKRRLTHQQAMERRRESVLHLYDTFNGEFPTLANTGYALYQSVVEAADFYNERVTDPKRTAEISTTGWLATAKERAFALLAVNPN